MFEASVDGEAFDVERWGQYYKPAGLATPSGSSANAKAAVADTVDEAPFETAPAAKAEVVEKAAESGNDSSKRAADIIAMIRKRQAQ
jgi:hypothetical protein